jgi:hypothetical protein
VQSGLEEMRWIPCALDGCGYAAIRRITAYCIPDDGHNDA